MGRKRTCELPFCNGIVQGTHNKRRCDNDRNIHLHKIISENVKRIMRYIETHDEFTANDVNQALFKNVLDKNEKGSMYRLFQAMIREKYIIDKGKKAGLKIYSLSDEMKAKKANRKRSTIKSAEIPETDTSNIEESNIESQLEEAESNESLEDLQKIDEPSLPAKDIKTDSDVSEPYPAENETKKEEPDIPEVKLSPEEILIGKLKEYVYSKNGQWNHYDWMELINRPDIKEFGLSDEDIGRILEEQKTQYWTQRNS